MVSANKIKEVIKYANRCDKIFFVAKSENCFGQFPDQVNKKWTGWSFCSNIEKD